MDHGPRVTLASSGLDGTRLIVAPSTGRWLFALAFLFWLPWTAEALLMQGPAGATVLTDFTFTQLWI